MVPPLSEAEEQMACVYNEFPPFQTLFTHDVDCGTAEPTVQIDSVVVIGKALVEV